MKYFKLFLTVCAMAVAISASAQSKTTAKSKTAAPAKTTTAAPAKKATTTAKAATTTTAKPAAKATTTTAKATTTTTKATTTTTTKAAKTASSAAAAGFDPAVHFMMETKIGSYYGTGGWGENFVLEKEFNPYFAVDFFSIDFAMPFKISTLKEFSLGLKAGARGFTPRFWGGKARGFASLALGYDCLIAKGFGGYNGDYGDFGDYSDLLDGLGMSRATIDDYYDYLAGGGGGGEAAAAGDYGGGWGAHHGFAFSLGAGVQFVDRVYVGYCMEYSTIFKHTAHYGKIGIRF